MEIIITALIYILAIVGFIATVIRIVSESKIILDKIQIKRKRIARIDILWNSVENTDKRLTEAEDAIFKTENKLGDIGKLANNFERDMDIYHKNINKDIDERMKAIADRLAIVEEKRAK